MEYVHFRVEKKVILEGNKKKFRLSGQHIFVLSVCRQSVSLEITQL